MTQPNARPLDVMPPRAVTEALRSFRRKVELLRVLDDMIAFQQERLIWLRAKEIETGEPLLEISRTLRVLDYYLDRKERLSRDLGAWPPPDRTPKDEPTQPELEPMSEEDYNDMMDVIRRHGEWLDEHAPWTRHEDPALERPGSDGGWPPPQNAT